MASILSTSSFRAICVVSSACSHWGSRGALRLCTAAIAIVANRRIRTGCLVMRDPLSTSLSAIRPRGPRHQRRVARPMQRHSCAFNIEVPSRLYMPKARFDIPLCCQVHSFMGESHGNLQKARRRFAHLGCRAIPSSPVGTAGPNLRSWRRGVFSTRDTGSCRDSVQTRLPTELPSERSLLQ